MKFTENIDRLNYEDISYICDLPYYIETDEFICIHAGLEITNNQIIPLEQQNYKFMLFDRNFKSVEFKPLNKPILFGHTPCFYDHEGIGFIKTIKPNSNPNKFDSYIKIRLDTGVTYTKTLGVLCKETMQEIYIKE